MGLIMEGVLPVNGIVDLLFLLDGFILFILLFGSIWSVVVPEKRIWPPPGRRSWQYVLTWICFYSVFIFNAALFILDWNSWIFSAEIRLILGIPFCLVGALLVSWGVVTLGARNTSGLKDAFITAGPYRFTRNPQYLGDMILFIGLSLIANSIHLWITHILLILVFTITPLAEETWLEDQYGEVYRSYKRDTARFL